MEREKFKKGEWKVAHIGNNPEVYHVHTDEPDYGNEICTLYVGSKEQIEANAKLIAAAPEILKALKTLLTEVTNLIDHVIDQGLIDWEDESIDGVKEMDSARKLAIAAIKKATE